MTMIRILDERIYSDGLKLITGACVDADVTDLPTTGIITGSVMTCADSGDVYMFYEDESSPAWGKIVAGPTVDSGT